MCVQLVAALCSCLETVRRTATLAIEDSVRKRVWDIRHTVRRVRWTDFLLAARASLESVDTQFLTLAARNIDPPKSRVSTITPV
jgi:hypothetical protein